MWGNLYFVGKYAIFVGKKKLIMSSSDSLDPRIMVPASGELRAQDD